MPTPCSSQSGALPVPMERFAVSPEFIAPSAAPQEYKQVVFDFRDTFVDALASIEKESEDFSSDRGISLSRLFASPVTEVVFRWTCSPAHRAIFEAQLILDLNLWQRCQAGRFQEILQWAFGMSCII